MYHPTWSASSNTDTGFNVWSIGMHIEYLALWAILYYRFKVPLSFRMSKMVCDLLTITEVLNVEYLEFVKVGRVITILEKLKTMTNFLTCITISFTQLRVVFYFNSLSYRVTNDNLRPLRKPLI